MHTHGCVDSRLSQQVHQLLADPALHHYTAAFTPGSDTKTKDDSGVFTPGFMAKLHDVTSGSALDPTCSAADRNKLQTDLGVQCREGNGVNLPSAVTTRSTANPIDCGNDATCAPTAKKSAKSLVPPLLDVQAGPSPDPTPIDGCNPQTVEVRWNCFFFANRSNLIRNIQFCFHTKTFIIHNAQFITTYYTVETWKCIFHHCH